MIWSGMFVEVVRKQPVGTEEWRSLFAVAADVAQMFDVPEQTVDACFF